MRFLEGIQFISLGGVFHVQDGLGQESLLPGPPLLSGRPSWLRGKAAQYYSKHNYTRMPSWLRGKAVERRSGY